MPSGFSGSQSQASWLSIEPKSTASNGAQPWTPAPAFGRLQIGRGIRDARRFARRKGNLAMMLEKPNKMAKTQPQPAIALSDAPR
jgi:hypothetical protein